MQNSKGSTLVRFVRPFVRTTKPNKYKKNKKNSMTQRRGIRFVSFYTFFRRGIILEIKLLSRDNTYATSFHFPSAFFSLSLSGKPRFIFTPFSPPLPPEKNQISKSYTYFFSIFEYVISISPENIQNKFDLR